MESLPSKLVMKSSTSASSSQVWMAIKVWHDKPHVINRRVTGAVPILTSNIDKSVPLNEVYKSLIDTKITKSMADDEIKQIFSSMDIYKKDEDGDFGLCLTLRKLIPRNSSHHLPLLEITILDEVHCKATFFSLHQEHKQHIFILETPYTFQFVEGEIQLVAHVDELAENPYISWLMKSVFPKIEKWAECTIDQNIPSLSLVSVDRYTLLYQDLKKKYGQKMVEIWPESTDPLKFVYEDVAIAAYLLLLWEKQREELGQPDLKQTFVDLGCGNGLLVHILACEGHKGFGIDVRKRGIWDLYPSTTVLKMFPHPPWRRLLLLPVLLSAVMYPYIQHKECWWSNGQSSGSPEH
ncbi:probable tRNA (uracil-O(2)-)-methyltransferase isoform X2 [Anabrus simplex]|uniref:probable tRNA (uracil-O(2)-)-methyltransferase isoform X2 n=1 Tax=Anabrus simplex TaxID=316456 RepID=UPI0035A2F02D